MFGQDDKEYWRINLVNLAHQDKHLTFTLLPGHHYKALPSQEEGDLIDTFKVLPALDEEAPRRVIWTWSQVIWTSPADRGSKSLCGNSPPPIGVHAWSSQSDHNEDNTNNNS